MSTEKLIDQQNAIELERGESATPLIFAPKETALFVSVSTIEIEMLRLYAVLTILSRMGSLIDSLKEVRLPSTLNAQVGY